VSTKRLPDPILGNRFADAVRLAVELQSEQARKGSTIPYLGHLLGVCGLVIDAGGSEDEAIAAVLHDAVEDQGGEPTLDIIRARFGENVAAIVGACSDTDKMPKPPWRARKEEYIEHLKTASESALRVSVADKLNNLRAIVRDYGQMGEALWERFNPDGDQVWYYGALLRVFQERLPGPVTEELRQAYNALLEAMKVADACPSRDGSRDGMP
jgi:(p)ppGpp synthase/HD superfamily hydrolase